MLISTSCQAILDNHTSAIMAEGKTSIMKINGKPTQTQKKGARGYIIIWESLQNAHPNIFIEFRKHILHSE